MAHERTDSYIKDSTAIFRYYKKLGENAMAQCPDAGLVALLDAESNSIATIVKHMAGNMISPAISRDPASRKVSDSLSTNICFGWWVQPVVATHSANFSAGV